MLTFCCIWFIKSFIGLNKGERIEKGGRGMTTTHNVAMTDACIPTSYDDGTEGELFGIFSLFSSMFEMHRFESNLMRKKV